jgi:hypothetical protein
MRFRDRQDAGKRPLGVPPDCPRMIPGNTSSPKELVACFASS